MFASSLLKMKKSRRSSPPGYDIIPGRSMHAVFEQYNSRNSKMQEENCGQASFFMLMADWALVAIFEVHSVISQPTDSS